MEHNNHNGDWRMRRIKRIHFVGIGGVGMSGIAEVLLNEGYAISGTDLYENPTIVRLRSLGASINIGHFAQAVEGADVVVQSSAIHADNVEIKQAKALRIPVVARAQMLAELMRFRRGIAVAGTHGKTTTTSLIASVLAEARLDPTYVIGGILNGAGSNARLGLGQYFVAEADESDASFLYLQPLISVVTNIDVDHMATYQNDPLRLEQTFIDFLHHLPFYGLCVLCIDDPVVRKCLPKINRQQITYGFDEDADWVAHDYHQKGTSCTFTAGCKKEDVLMEVQLNLPGRHNALNALAAIAIAYELGVEQSSVVEALKSFGGIKRRFSILGEFPVEGGHAVIVDDYGHHPREIDATLAAARAAWPDQRIVLVFQPHRYTRTADLFEDFSLTLSKADELLLLDVYPAGEAPIAGADSRDLCRSVRTRGQVDPIFIGELAELRTALNSFLRPNDIVLMQGAGSIGTAALQLVNSK